MQVGIDVTYMYTNFGGCDLFCFGDIGTFKNGQISPSTSVVLVNYITKTKTLLVKAFLLLVN